MIEFDTTHAPLMYVDCYGDVDLAEIEQYLESHGNLLDSEVEHALLVDLVGASLGSESDDCMLKLSGWLDRRSQTLNDVCRACGVVVEGQVGRALDVIAELQSLRLATRVFLDTKEAIDWLRPVYDRTREESAGETGGLGGNSSAPELASGDARRSGSAEVEESRWSPYRNSGSADTPVH